MDPLFRPSGEAYAVYLSSCATAAVGRHAVCRVDMRVVHPQLHRPGQQRAEIKGVDDAASTSHVNTAGSHALQRGDVYRVSLRGNALPRDDRCGYGDAVGVARCLRLSGRVESGV